MIDRRVTAEIEGSFVVFLIGMRINRPWKPWRWGPTAAAMPRMIKELEAASRAKVRDEVYPEEADARGIEV